ncbi:MAG: hypothetical protein ACRERR_04915 [Moraxellaceae bacterium]
MPQHPKSSFRSRHDHSQHSWLRWLLLFCLLGLQIHAPQHALKHLVAAQMGAAEADSADTASALGADSSHAEAGAPSAPHHSALPDCCPAGLMAMAQSASAAAASPLTPPQLTDLPLALADAQPNSPYQSRAPPV